MKEIIIVAVDGPAGSGKSSVSKEVAKKSDLKYIDSGALYRSVTWYFLSLYDEIPDNFQNDLDEIDIKQEFDRSLGDSKTFVNGKDISRLIRDEKITANIGIISDKVEVREYITKILRKWSSEESIIMDGRDIGSVVFPEADIKIYLDASVDIRASRRIKEYNDLGKKVDEKAIKKQIIQRDKQDMEREFGALRVAEGAIVLDTSNMNINEVTNKITEIILKFKEK
jgi:CMP/dCMP kinase